jgi:hypothetical protein
MKYRTRFVKGDLTIGEARSTVGMLTGVEANNVEAFVVLSYAHVDRNCHELVIVSSFGESYRDVDMLLYIAHQSIRGDYATYQDVGRKRLFHGRRLRIPHLHNRDSGERDSS